MNDYSLDSRFGSIHIDQLNISKVKLAGIRSIGGMSLYMNSWGC